MRALPSTLTELLTWWYGPPGFPVTPFDGDLGPAPLREWFEVSSMWGTPLTQYTHEVDPRDQEMMDGRLVVWSDIEDDWKWGVDPGPDDPEVFQRPGPRHATPGPWTATGLPLSRFLVYATAFEAITAAEHQASAVHLDRSTRDEVLAPADAVPGGGWRFAGPEAHLLTGTDLLALTGRAEDTEDERWWVYVAGRTHEATAYLRDVTGVVWEHCCWEWDCRPEWSGQS
jgi:hypothetical protein